MKQKEYSFHRKEKGMDMKKKFSIKSVILVFVIIYVCYLLIAQQVTMSRQKKELQKYNLELQNKTEEKKVLQDEVQLSKTDKYIEKLAREILGLVKEGETPVIDNKK